MPERLAISMWDFSWLTRRAGRENEYADWDRVLDELAERGYNCVRIDAFPHLIHAGLTRAEILPQRPRFMWGNHEPVTVDPRAGLVEFVRKARERGIRIGLSTWFVDDATHARNGIVAPEDFAAVWRTTLDVLAAEGLLDAIAWVDLCNEFPLGLWAPGAYRRIFRTSWPNPMPVVRRWSMAERADVASYFSDAIAPLRAAYPQLQFTFSFQGFGAGNIRRLPATAFDCVEVHAWVVESPRLLLRSGQLLALMEAPGGAAVHRALAPIAWRSGKRQWLEDLGHRLDKWKAWAEDRPIYTSEGWASIYFADPSVDGAGWKWIKTVCAEAMPLALARGWTGLCTSNFSQPHFSGIWNDVGWHQGMTTEIRRSSSER